MGTARMDTNNMETVRMDINNMGTARKIMLISDESALHLPR
jgi:hypothetical protein